MMKLNKRYRRSIRDNLSFYISSVVLTAAALLMFYLFNIAGNAIHEFSADFFPQHNIEDAHFTTYLPISDADISKLEEEYDVTLEAQRFINIRTDGVTSRVFRQTDKIDLYEVTVGEDVKNDDEIIISEGFAVYMKVSVGDSMEIGDKSYTVTGFMQRPDYLYMLENEDDTYKNISTFYLAYMTDDAFDALGDAGCVYLVKYHGDNSLDFRRSIHDTYHMQSYTAASDNMRIRMVNEQADMFIIMSYAILFVLPLIAVALVSIIISRKVKNEQKMIGTLTALGYKKGRLMLHYAGFAAIPGIMGGVLTAVVSALAAQGYSEAGLNDYEPMRIVGHLDPLIAILGVIVPTLMYVLAALISVRRLLKKDTVLLLSGNANTSEKKRKQILSGSKLSFRTKFALRSLVGSPMRGFVVFLGVFLGCFIMLFGFSVFDSFEIAGGDAFSSVGTYKYQYVLNELNTQNPYGGAEMLVAAAEDEDGNAVTLFGTDADNPYLYFRDESGKDVDVSDGCYITSLAALTRGWQAGDRVTLLNPLTLEKQQITVAGVLKNDISTAIYMSKQQAAELAGLEGNVFNALISDEKLSIPSSKIAVEANQESFDEQLQTAINQMSWVVWLLVGLGAIICIASVYVAVNMMVTENRSNISMLKVLGYKDRKISRIVLSVNHIFLPLGIALSIPAALGVMDLCFVLLADMLSMLVKAALLPQSLVIGIAMTAASYFLSLLLVRRKVKRVDMIESLKDNRE